MGSTPSRMGAEDGERLFRRLSVQLDNAPVPVYTTFGTGLGVFRDESWFWPADWVIRFEYPHRQYQSVPNGHVRFMDVGIADMRVHEGNPQAAVRTAPFEIVPCEQLPWYPVAHDDIPVELQHRLVRWQNIKRVSKKEEHRRQFVRASSESSDCARMVNAPDPPSELSNPFASDTAYHEPDALYRDPGAPYHGAGVESDTHFVAVTMGPPISSESSAGIETAGVITVSGPETVNTLPLLYSSSASYYSS